MIAPAQSTLAPEVLLLSKIKRQAKDDLTRLPNFTCLETIQRSQRNSDTKPMKMVDVVRVEVAHVGDKEMFSWPGESKFESRELTSMIGTGMVSTGEFAGQARNIFIGGAGIIHYGGEEELQGRRAARFDYEVSALFAAYTIYFEGASASTGLSGSFWADAETLDLLRMTAEATDIPGSFPMRRVSSMVDYGRVQVGGERYLLPQTAIVVMLLDSGLQKENRTDFTHCRQYATESVLSFPSDEDNGKSRAADKSEPAASPAVEMSLPAGLIFTMNLQSAIRPGAAKIGDEISAIVESDVKVKGRTVVPKGTVVSGRLRMVQKVAGRYALGLEFTDLNIGNSHARFFGDLVTIDPRFADSTATATLRVRTILGVQHYEELTVPQLPGVGAFMLNDGQMELPKGTEMEWKTVRLAK